MNKKAVGAKIFNAQLLIRNASDGKKYLYYVIDIKRENSSSLSQSWIAKMDKNSSSSLSNSISHSAEKSTENAKKVSGNEKDLQMSLKPYLRKLDLSSIKGDIKHVFGKDSSPYLLWQKRRGEVGMTPDQVAEELKNTIKREDPISYKIGSFLIGGQNKPPVLPGERKTSGATIKMASLKQAIEKN